MWVAGQFVRRRGVAVGSERVSDNCPECGVWALLNVLHVSFIIHTSVQRVNAVLKRVYLASCKS